MIERVAFDAPYGTEDGFGGKSYEWAEQFRTRASFVFLRGGEKIQAGRLSGTQSVVATIRKSGDADVLKGTWRMRDLSTGKIYLVRSIEPNRDKPRQLIDVLCESVHEG